MKNASDDKNFFKRVVRRFSGQTKDWQNLYPRGIKPKRTERSFTIIETLAALAILLPVVIETVSTQGSIINNNSYMRRVTEATWLAKRLMAQVEYNYHAYPIKDLDGDQEGQFKIKDLPEEFDYTYKVSIQEWKLPLFDLLMQGGPKPEGEEEETESSGAGGGALGAIPGIKQVIDSLFEGHILKLANVEVFWPEGARRDSVTLTLLLTNQKALDQYIVSKKKVMRKMNDDIESAILGKKPGSEKDKGKDKDGINK